MPITATRRISVSEASAGTVNSATSWIPTDIHQTPFNIGFAVTKLGGGNVTFRIQHTFDDIFNANATAQTGGVQVFTHPDFTAATVSKDGNYAYGVRAVRMLIVSACGSSTCDFDLVQVG